MARLTVRILSRYVLRQHLAPLVFALAALTCFLLIQQVAKQLGNLVGKGLPWGVIVEVFVLSIPFIVATTLPMAVLVAVLYAFTHLAGDNEITAMQASGVSVGRVIAPVLGGATVVALLSFLWNDQVLPRSNHRLRTLQVDIQRKKPSFTLKEQVINEVVPGQFFLRAARIDPNSNKLKDVTIYDLGDAERRRIIGADSGRMAYTPGGRDLYLTLEDGDIQAVNRTDPTQFDRTFFRTNRMRVAGIGNTLERTEHDSYKSDREMSICEMRGMVALARREADRAGADADVAVQNDLRRLAGLVLVYPAPPPYVADTAPVGLYCHALRRAAAWLGPKAAAAQTPTPRPFRPHPQPQRPTEHPPFGPARVPPPAAVSQAQSRPTLITPAATVGEEQRRRSAEQRAAMYEVEIQKKYAIAAACIVFALVGAPAALRYYRGGVGLVIGLSVAVFTVCYLPETVTLVLPVAVLFAVVFTVGALDRHSELTAAKASGISFHRVIRPLLAASVVAVLADLGLTELAPVTSSRRAELLGQKQIRSDQFRNNFVYRADGGWVYAIGGLELARHAMRGLIMEREGTGPEYPTIVIAAPQASYDTARRARGWTLTKGTVHYLLGPGREAAFTFDRLAPRDLRETPVDLLAEPKAPDEMRYAELGRYIDALARSGSDTKKLRVERALKLSVPFACIIIALFGAPLAISTPKSGAAWGVAVCLATTFVDLLMFQLSKAVGAGGVLPPSFAAWVPNLIFGAAGVWLWKNART